MAVTAKACRIAFWLTATVARLGKPRLVVPQYHSTTSIAGGASDLALPPSGMCAPFSRPRYRCFHPRGRQHRYHRVRILM
ncbi:hypothetical protein GE09DRAFT_1102364 [Coniochaeta sp. 2T2.1]|nr:hypothetical protein GE09DRAFT_1102364 [Coniochaeta sp. 2T2.1]